MQAENYKDLEEHFFECFNPPPVYTVAEWADKHRYLSQKASAEPGRWRTERTPYLKEIMECLSDNSVYQEIIFMKGSQVGGSECGNNWIGYTIDHSPAPLMFILPNLELAKRTSKQRIAPLIEENEKLNEKVNLKKSRDSDNTILQKDFPGGVLIMTGANSAAGLKSTPAKKLFFDEIDEYPLDVGGQGDPVKMAEVRSRTFGGKRKSFKVSTPTIEGRSRIQKDFLRSDQRYFHVPCPDCGEYQKLEFKQLRWPKDEPEKAVYLCISCEYEIKNHEKTNMLKKGRWIPENANDSNKKIAGFHLNSLYSPVGWLSWAEIAKEWVEANEHKDPLRLKTIVNTIFGETWKEKSDTPDWHRLYERREGYKIGTVPSGVIFLTCGVDVQNDRLEAEIVGWGRNKESWSIDYRVLVGDTSEDIVWNKLEELLNETFPLASNEGLSVPIRLMAVDSGFNTQMVYNWCRKFPMNKVVPVKGRDTLQLTIGLPKSVDINFRGQYIKNGVKLWTVGSSLIKGELYSWLKHDKATGEKSNAIGYCHFPEYDEEFFKQLTAEKLAYKIVRGYRVPEWEKLRERNEALDCRVYSRAAASICGIDRFTEENWKKLEKDITVSTSKTKKKKQIKRRESSWL